MKDWMDTTGTKAERLAHLLRNRPRIAHFMPANVRSGDYVMRENWLRRNRSAIGSRIRHLRLELARLRKKHTAEDWAWLLAQCGGVCLACGVGDNAALILKDHVLPISAGGSDGLDNLQPLCWACNHRKAATTADHRSPALQRAVRAYLEGIA